MNSADFAIVGLGRIGGGLARQAIENGLKVAGHTRSGAPGELVRAGLLPARRTEDLAALLVPPRKILLYIPAGKAVDDMLDALAATLQPGDIVADGGNSYWGDSVRRAERMSESGLRFIDLGTSGGVEGARRGACFMAGGDPAAVQALEPILRRMAVDGGYVHAGPSGAGHFTKLVHNGIEFGMLQAIGEGLQLLERYPQPLPIKDVLAAWRHGSVIRSWLIDLMESAYRHEGGLDAVPPMVEDTGEVNWLVADALQMEVPVPVIALAAMQLAASRDGGKEWARAIAMMRKGFGGHPYGPDESIAKERRSSRVGASGAAPQD